MWGGIIPDNIPYSSVKEAKYTPFSRGSELLKREALVYDTEYMQNAGNKNNSLVWLQALQLQDKDVENGHWLDEKRMKETRTWKLWKYLTSGNPHSI